MFLHTNLPPLPSGLFTYAGLNTLIHLVTIISRGALRPRDHDLKEYWTWKPAGEKPWVVRAFFSSGGGSGRFWGDEEATSKKKEEENKSAGAAAAAAVAGLEEEEKEPAGSSGSSYGSSLDAARVAPPEHADGGGGGGVPVPVVVVGVGAHAETPSPRPFRAVH